MKLSLYRLSKGKGSGGSVTFILLPTFKIKEEAEVPKILSHK